MPDFYPSTYPNLFRAIRSDARRWWFHDQLRRQGRHQEARQREHASCQGNVATLREAQANGGFVTIGLHGEATLYVGGECDTRISGLHPGLKWAALQLLPSRRFDLATVPDAVQAAIKGPMVRPERSAFRGLDRMESPREAGPLDVIPASEVNAHPVAALVPLLPPGGTP